MFFFFVYIVFHRFWYKSPVFNILAMIFLLSARLKVIHVERKWFLWYYLNGHLRLLFIFTFITLCTFASLTSAHELRTADIYTIQVEKLQELHLWHWKARSGTASCFYIISGFSCQSLWIKRVLILVK